MSGYILCQTKKAEHPYFIENISMNIYSIEELCYFLYHNLYLADHTVFNEELCTWLNEELGLTGLAAKLRQNLDRNVSAEDMLYPVFKEINYLTYEEMKELNGQIAVLEKERAAIRQKRKGDSLIENGMYVNAIQIYQKILERDDLDEQRKGLKASVLYNLGCAYSYLFQMEKAGDCFMQAYKREHSAKALKSYILAYRSIHDKINYNEIFADLEVEEEIKNEVEQNIHQVLKEFAAVPEKKAEETELDALLERLTREYHRSTGS